MSRRLNKVEEACKEVLSEVLQREVKDPRVGFVTITSVKVSPDLRHAKVYVSVLGTREDTERSFEGLESSKGYMRSELGKHLRIKYLPEIEIVKDDVSEEALHLAEVFRRVEADMEESGDGEDGPV
ncbi:MAG TPA: 30S ribosome-binding factor RbfA [Candidatus Anoxymicrobiaceae bacterium]|jgi:ribosome-binding factor A